MDAWDTPIRLCLTGSNRRRAVEKHAAQFADNVDNTKVEAGPSQAPEPVVEPESFWEVEGIDDADDENDDHYKNNMGGRNIVLLDAVSCRIPLVSDIPTIIFGADVTHPENGGH
ncbi:hypothetical protein RIF29_00703 [Crotalaria pallida]|uniref:Piwi domain-containing protein n=1 Tax=Crotalaria pallida TaxID=3830 RepID=A0AAN9IVW0_CROPI